MFHLKNNTPFVSHMYVTPNLQGGDTLYIIVKATFDLTPEIHIADNQQPIITKDIYWGEPGKSSLKYPTEIHSQKPGTDVIVIGEACAPHDQPVDMLNVGVLVADRLCILKVFGDRYWKKGFVFTKPSKPRPFTRMPLVYERAFGGMHIIEGKKSMILMEAKNPVGKGFLGKRSYKQVDEIGVPNIEDYKKTIKAPENRPRPVGYGAIASSWEPRISYFGTIDAKWKKTGAPDLPEDFDPRFYHAAHPDLIFTEYLKGGEQVVITNMSPRRKQTFNLPACEPKIEANIIGRFETVKANLETVLMEPTEERISLVWRAATTSGQKITEAEAEVSL